MAKSKDQLGNPALLALLASKQGDSKAGPPLLQDKLLRNIVLGALGIGAGTGLFFLGRSIIRNAAFKSAVNKTDDIDNPENAAQRLINAFANDAPFGWGTDEVAIRETVRAIGHRKNWEAVKVAYKRLTKGRNLMNDLDAELSRSEKREIDLILSSLPANSNEAAQLSNGLVTTRQLDTWAERIYQASIYESSYLWPWGTDEDAIYAVLHELPKAATICQLEQTYKRKYSIGVMQQIFNEMQGEELNRAIRIIKNKPDVNGKTLQQIFGACRLS